MQTLALDRGGLPWDEFALRFSACASGVGSAIVGTRSLEHLRHNVGLLRHGGLPQQALEQIERRYAETGASWMGEI